jgi:hypothetical protein
VCDAGAMGAKCLDAGNTSLLSATKQAARALHTAGLRSTQLLLFTARTTTSQLVFCSFSWGIPRVCPKITGLAHAPSLWESDSSPWWVTRHKITKLSSDTSRGIPHNTRRGSVVQTSCACPLHKHMRMRDWEVCLSNFGAPSRL